MKLVDANLLIYAANEDAYLHIPARRWLEAALSGKETVGFPWNVLLAFLRLTTRQGLFPRPLAIATAFELIDSWLDQPPAMIVQPGPRHAGVLRDLLVPMGTGGNLTSDAHLAAIAIEQGAVLYSTDADFSRFPGLKWRNPLV